MVRIAKKSQFDTPEDSKQHRFQRKLRSHRVGALPGTAKQGRHHGWGYAKRRHALVGEE